MFLKNFLQPRCRFIQQSSIRQSGFESSNHSGFTLIELMFVLAILAIVLALAYPSYLDSVRKARRADATASLMERAQTMERCFTRFNTYEGCPDVEGASDDGFYTIDLVIPVGEPTQFTLTATPIGDQVNDACGPLPFTLDYRGNKTPPPDNRRCWGSL